MIKIAPSLLSADFANMGEATSRLSDWGSDMVHFDVMDGTFVPAITFGPAMCKAIRAYTKLPIDVHIMVEHPETYIEQFKDAGADYLTFHVEADRHAHRTLQAIRKAGMKAGIALNPATPAEMVEYVLSICDLVLVMSVNPGAGGQSFIKEVLPKVEKLKALREKNGYNYEIEMDGGINEATSKLAAASGADILVSGNAVFKADDPKEMIAKMHLAKK